MEPSKTDEKKIETLKADEAKIVEMTIPRPEKVVHSTTNAEENKAEERLKNLESDMTKLKAEEKVKEEIKREVKKEKITKKEEKLLKPEELIKEENSSRNKKSTIEETRKIANIVIEEREEALKLASVAGVSNSTPVSETREIIINKIKGQLKDYPDYAKCVIIPEEGYEALNNKMLIGLHAGLNEAIEERSNPGIPQKKESSSRLPQFSDEEEKKFRKRAREIQDEIDISVPNTRLTGRGGYIDRGVPAGGLANLHAMQELSGDFYWGEGPFNPRI